MLPYHKIVLITGRFAIVTATVTLFSRHPPYFVAAAKTTVGFCPSLRPFIQKPVHKNMATSTSGGENDRNAMLVGALRKAGIDKNPKDVTDEEWARILSPAQFAVLRESDTEPPFTGKYVDTKDEGSYHCAACGALLYSSQTKFDSHCGWPSFFDAVKADGGKASTEDGSNVGRRPDNSHGRIRTEIYCKVCGSHLGHVFDDGPQPTGERHCVNSASIEFSSGTVSKK